MSIGFYSSSAPTGVVAEPPVGGADWSTWDGSLDSSVVAFGSASGTFCLHWKQSLRRLNDTYLTLSHYNGPLKYPTISVINTTSTPTVNSTVIVSATAAYTNDPNWSTFHFLNPATGEGIIFGSYFQSLNAYGFNVNPSGSVTVYPSAIVSGTSEVATRDSFFASNSNSTNIIQGGRSNTNPDIYSIENGVISVSAAGSLVITGHSPYFHAGMNESNDGDFTGFWFSDDSKMRTVINNVQTNITSMGSLMATGGAGGRCDATYLSPGVGVMAFRNASGFPCLKRVSFDGTRYVAETTYVIESLSSGYLSILAISSTQVVVFWSRGSAIYFIVLDFTTAVPTVVLPATLAVSTESQMLTAAKITAGSVALVWQTTTAFFTKVFRV